MRKGMDVNATTGARPPYGAKERARRRAATKAAKRSRKRNRRK